MGFESFCYYVANGQDNLPERQVQAMLCHWATMASASSKGCGGAGFCQVIVTCLALAGRGNGPIKQNCIVSRAGFVKLQNRDSLVILPAMRDRCIKEKLMKNLTGIIIAAVIIIGGYVYFANQRATDQAQLAAANTAAASAKAAQVAVEAKLADALAAAKAASAKADQAKAAAALANSKIAAAEAMATAAKKAAAAQKAAAAVAQKAAVAAAQKAAAAAAKKAAAAAAAAKTPAKADITKSSAKMPPTFGSATDVAFAAQIWAAMNAQNLGTGPDALHSAPYEGTDPHGMILETFYTTAKIDGRTGDLIVKRNYGPAGVDKEQVMEAPQKHLGAVTVMFRREAGYDPETKNWFWAKFLPDGTLDKNPKGMALAGKVAKGMNVGCIACHSAADGGDFVYTSNHLK